MLDSGNCALVDVQADGHTISRQFFSRGLNPGVITTLGNVRAKNLEFEAFKRRPPEHLPLFKTRTGQGIHQHVGLYVLVTFYLDGGNRRPFLDRQYQHAGIATDFDVCKQAGPKQVFDGRSETCFINLLTNVDRERGKHRTCGYPLKAFYLDIRNREFVRQRWLHTGCGNCEANSYS